MKIRIHYTKIYKFIRKKRRCGMMAAKLNENRHGLRPNSFNCSLIVWSPDAFHGGGGGSKYPTMYHPGAFEALHSFRDLYRYNIYFKQNKN